MGFFIAMIIRISKKRMDFEGKLLIIAVVFAMIMNMAVPKVVSAKEPSKVLALPIYHETESPSSDASNVSEKINKEKFFKKIELAGKKEPKKIMTVTATAYNSTVAQCDSTPCIAAKGFNLCEHNEEDVIAANFLPINAKVKFPELYGDKEFTVVDRMNPKYYYRVDFWMKSYEDAKKFGVKKVKIEIH